MNKIYFKTPITSEEIVRSVNEKLLNIIEVALASVKRQQVIWIPRSGDLWRVSDIAYLHCQIRIPIRTANQIAKLYYTEMFTLHGVRFSFQS